MEQYAPRQYVVSLGGSLLFRPDGSVDTPFLEQFCRLVRERVLRGDRFVITVGGGRYARVYQEALSALHATDNERGDWIGIYATRFNAQFVRLLFADLAPGDIIYDPEAPLPDNSVIIAGGTTPGWSTDYVATLLGKRVGAERIINVTNVPYVYDKDPAQYPDAVAFESLTWDEYGALIPKEWVPGLHAPFDPRGAREAHAHHIDVCIVGKDIENLRRLLEDGTCVGTHIHA